MTRRSVMATAAALVLALVTGAVVGRTTASESAGADATEEPAHEATTSTSSTTIPPATNASSPPTTGTIPLAATSAPPPDADRAAAIAEVLDLDLPSQCPLPLDDPNLLPGAPRAYRNGIHEGIDFVCDRRGELAVAALDGRVVMAHDGFTDPPITARDAILDIARVRGSTPPWTLAMLYGRFVVIDHGQVPGAGHVATVYAHLEAIADGVEEGAAVSRRQILGEIGNSGTSFGSRQNADGIHLHWEIYVDDVHLGAGLPEPDVARVYAALFDG